MTFAACPYCGVVMEPAPNRKGKRRCKACKESFFVFNAETDFLKPKQFVGGTEADYKANEAAHHDYEAGRHFAWGLQIEEAEWAAMLGEARATNPEVDPGSVYYHGITQKIMRLYESPSEKDWRTVVALRERQIEQLLKEERDPLPVVKARVQDNFNSIVTSPNKGEYKGVFVGGGFCCDKCKRHSGDKFTFAQVSKKKPLPHADCKAENGVCQCEYRPDYHPTHFEDVKGGVIVSTGTHEEFYEDTTGDTWELPDRDAPKPLPAGYEESEADPQPEPGGFLAKLGEKPTRAWETTNSPGHLGKLKTHEPEKPASKRHPWWLTALVVLLSIYGFVVVWIVAAIRKDKWLAWCGLAGLVILFAISHLAD